MSKRLLFSLQKKDWKDCRNLVKRALMNLKSNSKPLESRNCTWSNNKKLESKPSTIPTWSNDIKSSTKPPSKPSLPLQISLLSAITMLGDEKLFNQLMHSLGYKINEPQLLQSILLFWLAKNNPRPCFKLLAKIKRERVVLGEDQVQLFLQACHMLDKRQDMYDDNLSIQNHDVEAKKEIQNHDMEPIAINEILIPYLRELNLLQEYRGTLLKHYSLYLPNKMAAKAIIDLFIDFKTGDLREDYRRDCDGKKDCVKKESCGEKGEMKNDGKENHLLLVLVKACGIQRDLALFQQIILKDRDIQLIKTFMNGWLDGGGSEEELESAIIEILG
jgi:hypothetical protein